MNGRPLACLTTGLALLLPVVARSAEFYTANLKLDPPAPYVNEPFSIALEIVVSPGCELQSMQLHGLPSGSRLELGELVAQPAVRSIRDGRAVETHRFRAEGRGAAAFAVTVQPIVQFMLVERRTMGFFSTWNTAPQRLQLPPVSLAVRELPAAGRPDDFAGAVGHFTLTGRLEPSVVMPMDIVDLTVELTGRGHLAEARPVLPTLDPSQFKTYPARETRDPGGNRLTLTQTLIPQTTQAVEVAATRFTFFDAQAARYRTVTAGPFRLTFTERKPDTAPAVRTVEVAAARPAPDRDRAVSIPAAMNREVRRVIPFAAGIAAALGCVAILRLRRRWLNVVLGLLIFTGVTWGVRTGMSGRNGPQRTLHQTVRLRLAPSESAWPLIEIPAGTPVQPLETQGNWIRIDARNRRGWIPAEALDATEE